MSSGRPQDGQSHTVPIPKSPQPRIQIQAVEPVLDCGRYAVKRTVGELVDVYATVFKDGHDILGGAVRVRGPGETQWREEPLTHLGNDRFGRHVHRRPARPLAVPRRGLDGSRRDLAGRAAAQGRRRGRRTWRASCRRARCCSDGR